MYENKKAEVHQVKSLKQNSLTNKQQLLADQRMQN